MKGLKGKSALVTGGARGIGWSIVRRLCEEGCAVWVADKDEEALLKLNPEQVNIWHVDISKSRAVKRARDIPFDILVNNAGVTQGDDHKRILETNINGTRNITEAVLPGMKKRGSGSVVFITSVHTALAFKGDAAYDASKYWIVGYMRSRALEYAGWGVRLNAVAPGAVKFAGPNLHASKEILDPLGERVPIKRFALPSEIASAVAFLASDEASYMTGAEIRVDGGLSINNSLTC